MVKSQVTRKHILWIVVILLVSVFYSSDILAEATEKVEHANVNMVPAVRNMAAAKDLLEEFSETSSYETITHAKEAIVPTTPKKPVVTTNVSNVSVGVGLPIRLTIPTIGVNAYIEHIGLTPQGAVGVPAGAVNVSWFSAGTRPGNVGSAVISGHYGIWKNGSHSVFDLLPTLQPGDIIYVKDTNNITRSFVVQKTRIYGKDEVVPEIFNKSDQAYLNLISCYGTYLSSQHTYDRRFVVFAKMN